MRNLFPISKAYFDGKHRVMPLAEAPSIPRELVSDPQRALFT